MQVLNLIWKHIYFKNDNVSAPPEVVIKLYIYILKLLYISTFKISVKRFVHVYAIKALNNDYYYYYYLLLYMSALVTFKQCVHGVPPFRTAWLLSASSFFSLLLYLLLASFSACLNSFLVSVNLSSFSQMLFFWAYWISSASWWLPVYNCHQNIPCHMSF